MLRGVPRRRGAGKSYRYPRRSEEGFGLLNPYKGGYVFARVFWEIYDTSPDLYPEDLPHHTFLNARDSNAAVDERMNPTERDLLAYVYAVRSFRDHEHYGFPYPGTIRDQPYLWKLAVDCVRDAINEARMQAAAEAKKRREQAARK